jgi:hypothetical protein
MPAPRDGAANQKKAGKVKYVAIGETTYLTEK